MQCSKTVSIHEYIVLLEENRVKNPEFHYDRFELAVMDNFKCKANYI